MKTLIVFFCSFTVVATTMAYDFSGHITSNTVWNEDMILTGDVWVDEGITLTVQAGITVEVPFLDVDMNGIGDIELEVNGVMNVNGIEEDPVFFRCLEDSTTSIGWQGITVSSSSTMGFTYLILQDAQQMLIETATNLQLNGCEIRFCDSPSLQISNPNSTILQNCQIHDSSGDGVLMDGSGMIQMDNCYVMNNGYDGLVIQNTDPTITSTTVVNNGNRGIVIFDADPVITDCISRNNMGYTALVADDGSNPTISHCTFFPDAVAFYEGSTGSVTMCKLGGINISRSSFPVINDCEIKATSESSWYLHGETHRVDIGPEEGGVSVEIEPSAVIGDFNTGYGFAVIQDEMIIEARRWDGGGTRVELWYDTEQFYEYYSSSYGGFTLSDHIYVNSSDYSDPLRLGIHNYEFYGMFNIAYAQISESNVTAFPFICYNSSGIVDAQYNYWYRTTDIDTLVYQRDANCVNYANFVTDPILGCGSSVSNISPSISITYPFEMVQVEDTLTFVWDATDPDENATIDLYYSLIENEPQANLIISGLEEDYTSSYTWDMSELPYDVYYPYAIIHDSNAAADTSWSAPVMRGHLQVNINNTLWAPAGGELIVPVNVVNLTEEMNALAFEFELYYDDALLTYDSADLTGTICEGWSVPNVNTDTPHIVSVNSFNTTPASGDGVLIYIRFMVDPEASDFDESTLSFFSFLFNEGEPAVETVDGGMTVLNIYSISGILNYYGDYYPVIGGDIVLTGLVDTLSTQTDTTGLFLFEDVVSGDYTLETQSAPEPNTDCILAYDAALTAQYSIGLITLDPLQEAAADVSGNGDVSAFDAALIAQYSIGIISEFPAGPEMWIFSPEFYNYVQLGANQENQDFHTIILGDVSGNWSPVVTMDYDPGLGENIIANINESTVDIMLIPENHSPLSYNAFVEYDVGILSDPEIIVPEGVESISRQSEEGIYLALWQSDETADLNQASIRFIRSSNTASLITVRDCYMNETAYTEESWLIGSENIVPATLTLLPNYPNPFNPATRLRFVLPDAGQVQLVIYNALGREVQSLMNETRDAGMHEIVWNVSSSPGNHISSGVYFARLDFAGEMRVQKLLLIK
jgi:hypothetical protein